MTTLFITATWPHPLANFRHGMALRMRLMLRALQQVDDTVDVLAYVPWNLKPEAGAAERMREDFAALWGVRIREVHLAPSVAVADRMDSLWHGYIKPMVSLRYQPSYARTSGPGPARSLERVVARSRPDHLFVQQLQAMCPVLTSRDPLPPTVLDLNDVEHRAFARSIALPPHWGAKRLMRGWIPALRRGERKALAKARVSFVCSALDRDYLKGLWQLDSVQEVPNALPVPVPSPLPAGKTALFLGMHSYPPNRTGAEFLIEKIWPQVLRRHPDARLVIAGKGCELIRGHDQPPPGVEFAGYVDSLDALYSRTRVVCCPILSGGGTRIKIIEGALQARPVVSTTIGAEGLDLSPDRGEIAIADCPEQFGEHVARLLNDTPAAAEMAARARDRAIAQYGEDKVVRQIAELLREAGW